MQSSRRLYFCRFEKRSHTSSFVALDIAVSQRYYMCSIYMRLWSVRCWPAAMTHLFEYKYEWHCQWKQQLHWQRLILLLWYTFSPQPSAATVRLKPAVQDTADCRCLDAERSRQNANVWLALALHSQYSVHNISRHVARSLITQQSQCHIDRQFPMTGL